MKYMEYKHRVELTDLFVVTALAVVLPGYNH